MVVGKRVRFRAIEKSDLAAMARWLNDPEMGQMVVGWSFPVSNASQDAWFERSGADNRNIRLIVETHEGEVIGLTGLWDIDWHNRHALTALKLDGPKVQGKGFGTDAILTLCSYAFYTVGLERLWGEILPFIVASYRAYVEKCGWRVEGRLRNHVYRAGRMWDLYRVGILRSDFDLLEPARDYRPSRPKDEIVVHPEYRGEVGGAS